MPSQGHSRNALFWSLPTPILSSLRRSGKNQSLSERPPLPSRLHRGQIRTFQGLGSTNSVARAWCIRMTASTGRQESRVSKDWWLREGQWKARGKRDPAFTEEGAFTEANGLLPIGLEESTKAVEMASLTLPGTNSPHL